MNSLLKPLLPAWLVAQHRAPSQHVARSLMERAESRAGRSPYHAQELRIAACAYLSVVR